MWSSEEAAWELDRASGSGEYAIDTSRVPLSVSVALYIDGHLRVERTTHIWAHGLAIATREPLEIGTSIEVELFLPGGFDVHSRAVVRRHRTAHRDGANGAGIEVDLLDLDTWARTAIANHVAARLP